MGKRAENGGLNLAQRCRKLSSTNAPKKRTQCETRVQQFKRLRPRGIGAGMISRPRCKVPHFHVMYKIYIRIQRKSTSHPFVVPQPAPLKCVLPRRDTLRQTAELASMDLLPMCTPLCKNCIRQAHLLGEHTVTYHTCIHIHTRLDQAIVRFVQLALHIRLLRSKLQSCYYEPEKTSSL